MKRVPAVIVIGFIFIAIFAMLIFAHAASQKRQADGRPLVFRSHTVFDQQGLGLEAFRLLVPKDWVFNGGITWNFAKHPPEASVIYMITSPDGKSAIQQFPGLRMYWSQDQQQLYSSAQGGLTIMQPLGAIDFLKGVFISQARQGVREMKVIETQPLPGMAQQALAEENLMLNIFGQISPFTFSYQTRCDAGRVKVEYIQNGLRMVEDFTASIFYFITNTPTLSGMYSQNIYWSPSVCSFRAPAEEMPAKIRQFQIALYSRFMNPVWIVSYTRLCAVITREQLRQQQAIFARYQQIRQTLQECNDIIWQTYQNRSAAEDRMFDNYTQALRGVDTYVDPINNWNVDLPTGYENAWTNGTDYVFSDSANFNPNVISTGNWQKMTRKR